MDKLPMCCFKWRKIKYLPVDVIYKLEQRRLNVLQKRHVLRAVANYRRLVRHLRSQLSFWSVNFQRRCQFPVSCRDQTIVVALQFFLRYIILCRPAHRLHRLQSALASDYNPFLARFRLCTERRCMALQAARMPTSWSWLVARLWTLFTGRQAVARMANLFASMVPAEF